MANIMKRENNNDYADINEVVIILLFVKWILIYE